MPDQNEKSGSGMSVNAKQTRKPNSNERSLSKGGSPLSCFAPDSVHSVIVRRTAITCIGCLSRQAQKQAAVSLDITEEEWRMDDPRHLKRGNLLWESSRMFLPEHKEQLLAHRRRQQVFEPPELDEDRIRRLNEQLGEAFASGRRVAVTSAGTWGPETRSGRITRVDPLRGRLQLETEDDSLWLPFGKLLQIDEIGTD